MITQPVDVVRSGDWRGRRGSHEVRVVVGKVEGYWARGTCLTLSSLFLFLSIFCCCCGGWELGVSKRLSSREARAGGFKGEVVLQVHCAARGDVVGFWGCVVEAQGFGFKRKKFFGRKDRYGR